MHTCKLMAATQRCQANDKPSQLPCFDTSNTPQSCGSRSSTGRGGVAVAARQERSHLSLESLDPSPKAASGQVVSVSHASPCGLRPLDTPLSNREVVTVVTARN